jgi:uncharacterized iron-regulated protein
MRLIALFFMLVLGGCSVSPARTAMEPWEQRLAGDAIVMLGEVHDNPWQHRLRLEVLQRAFAAGWRPAIAMEQLDRERQADIDQARRERPGDAGHVIDRGTPPRLSAAAASGWDWKFYRPFVELALRYDEPLLAANLSSADATRIVRGGYGAVFSDADLAALGLGQPVPADLQAAQEREIDAGHCHALPRTLWPRMARAQFARDAVMAALLRGHAGRGIVLLAGDGHVRRDIGVWRWLGPAQSRAFTVGYLEQGDAAPTAAAFDAVVRTRAAERDDPCARFARPAIGR